jgi:capsule polysaccharide export protein KpsC/LpsZ
VPLARRTKKRSLDELVAAALILYPRYWVPRLVCLVEVETAIAQLKQPKQIEHWLSTLKAHLLLWIDRLSNSLGQGPK